MIRTLFAALDHLRYKWAQLKARHAATPNACAPLQLAYQAVTDAADSMDAVYAALEDEDYAEAKRLLALAHESLVAHEETIKGQL